MNLLTKSYYLDIRKRYYTIVPIIFTICVCLLYNLSQHRLLLYLTLFCESVTAIFCPLMGLAFYNIASIYIGKIAGGTFQIILLLLAIGGIILKNFSIEITKKSLGTIWITIMMILLSCLFGYKVNTITAFLLFISIVAYVAIVEYGYDKDIEIVVWSYFCSAFGMLLNIILQLGDMNNLLKYGRLSFEGEIKGLAVICTIPLVLLLSSKMEGKNYFRKKNRIITFIFMVACLTVIILTAARGVIIALLMGILFQFIMTSNKRRAIKIAITISGVFLSIIILFGDSNLFRIDRLFELSEMSSGNGRTEIWSHYFELIVDRGILSILFGVGPGEVSRISSIGYYSHSTFIDFFFSYGVVGIIFIGTLEFNIIRQFYLNRSINYLILSIILIFVYFGHGSAANSTLFILQGVMVSCCKKERSFVNE